MTEYEKSLLKQPSDSRSLLKQPSEARSNEREVKGNDKLAAVITALIFVLAAVGGYQVGAWVI